MEKNKCSFDPKIYAEQPIGMFHCPECGDMVLSGMDHPDYDNIEEKYQAYLHHKYEAFKDYLKNYLDDGVYQTFLFFIETHTTVKHTLMEIWSRCDMNEDHKCMHCNKDVPGHILYCSEMCEKAQEFLMAQEPKL